jgi:hypothetical protein
MFSTVRDAEGNIKRYRDSTMLQRWFASVLLECEKGFRRIKGYPSIPEVIRNIEAEENILGVDSACITSASEPWGEGHEKKRSRHYLSIPQKIRNGNDGNPRIRGYMELLILVTIRQ